MRAGVHQLGGGDLVLPRLLDAARTPRGHQLRGGPDRPLRPATGTRRHDLDVGEPVLTTRDGGKSLDEVATLGEAHFAKSRKRLRPPGAPWNLEE